MPRLSAPRDVKHLWNKEPGIWFPRWAELAAKQAIATRRPALFAYYGGTVMRGQLRLELRWL